MIFNWNAIFAKWVEDAVWYIPHISKIYISFLVILSISFRGIIMPLKKKVQTSYLFPFNWILVGILGLILDLTKAPGYIYGGIILLISKFNIKITPMLYIIICQCVYIVVVPEHVFDVFDVLERFSRPAHVFRGDGELERVGTCWKVLERSRKNSSQ